MWNEKQIIKDCKKKNRKAQKVLYQNFSAMFLGICMRYAVDKSEAENVLQEGFLKIFRNVDKFQNIEKTGAFIAWMKTIIVNTAISSYKKNSKHLFHKDIDEIGEYTMTENYSTADFTMSELLNVIKTLPDGYRMVFNLYAIEGYKHKEIAKMLNINISTSKTQYIRAKLLLQKKLEILKKMPI